MLSRVSLVVKKKRNYTSVHEAVKAGDVEQLALMIKSGAGVNEVDVVHKFTPLHCAAHSGSLELLVRWGACIDDVDNNGNLPAHLAAMEGHLLCFKFLLGKMASVTHTLNARNHQGETPRDLAEWFYKDNILQYIDGVKKEEEHSETQDPAEQGHIHCLQWLIEMGANCDITNDAGETPRDVAKRRAHLAAVELLIPRTGDSNSSDEELDANNIKFFERHGVEGSTDSTEDLTLDKAEKRNARIRAYYKIQELQQLLEIAYSNYRQLGGIIEEERKMKREERRAEKAVKELEAQLEYERVRREKLESQLDEYRAEINHLRESLEKTHIPPAVPMEAETIAKGLCKDKKKTKKQPACSPGGVFVRLR
ncbi:ankyrin repeat domain-containing protein 42 isoform X2 [Willisornis vidua]|uniref:Ankyrin repeat domain-containing protein 42 isoform X2 n=1 Tax=Willisornis vidua TaxID=1566151 RepID=A0ABQ9CZC7_9PASS|nr:ankyrin repeat domain-containing protein 42 isoform X2 [Willisornis vidua]